MQPVINIIINAARQAGDIITRHIELIDRIKVNTKAPEDYVSEVDVKAEQAIINVLHKAYPDYGIIAEESGVHQPDAECVWIIDPLDGTRNYLHGFPYYCVSIALQVKGQIEHGVIYDPLRHEIFTASRGRGARLNDKRLRVSKQAQLSSAMLCVDLRSHKNKQGHEALHVFSDLSAQCAGIRRTGSAALDLAYVASGRLDGCVNFGLQLWDVAAGYLLVQEAGGLVCDHDGRDTCLQSGDVIASSPKIFKSLLQVIDACHTP